MIQRLSHVNLWVLNQDEALVFYRDKLGFSVHTDMSMGPDFRWLTMTAPGAPDQELILMEPKPHPMMDAQTADQIRELVKKGALGVGVWKTADCRKTYEELQAKGVEFLQPATEKFYGIEAMLKDNSGNVLCLIQPTMA